MESPINPNLTESPQHIPTIDRSSVPEVKKILSYGTKDHTISLLTYNHREAVFRHCTREDSLLESESQVQMLPKLKEILDEINTKDTGIFFETPELLAIVTEKGKYIGSIQTYLPKDEEGTEIYPDMMYNNGVAKTYLLTIDRWNIIKKANTTEGMIRIANQWEEDDNTQIEKLKGLLIERENSYSTVSTKTNKSLRRVDEKISELRKQLSSPELDRLRKMITEWQNGDKEIDIDSVTSRSYRIEEELLKDNPQYDELNKERDKILEEDMKKFRDLEINKLKTEVESLEIFQSFKESIINSQGRSVTFDTLIISLQNRIQAYSDQYDEMKLSLKIFEAFDTLIANGFLVDTQGSGNLKGIFAEKDGKKILSIQLFDVGVLK